MSTRGNRTAGTAQRDNRAGAPRASNDVRTLKQRYLEACGQAFDRLVPEQGGLFGKTFTQIEQEVERQSRSLAALLCENRLAADPLTDPGRVFLCPKCGKPMRVQGQQQDRALSSTLGDVKMVRPYCVCDCCHFCCAPLDYALAIPAKGPSVGRRELVCNAATKDRSFDRATKTLSHHSNIRLSDEAVRKLAESEGRKLVDARARRVEACFNHRGRVAQAPCQPVPLLVVVCDGGMVQTRDPDKEKRWKSDKIGCVYDAEPRPDPTATTAETYRGATAITKTYVATMEPWQALGRMLFTEACARGYMNAAVKLFISDGAEAILALRDENFHNAHPLIDWYHVAEHLANCAKAAFGAGTTESQQWFEQNKTRLWYGELQQVIEAIRVESDRIGLGPQKAPDTDPRVILRRDVGYFTRNQQAMDYPAYRAKGWPIGSGVAEASVKQFGLRVKGSEQFWNLWGVEEMLALCELYYCEDGRWDKYWRMRSTPPPDATVFRTTSLSAPAGDTT